MKRKTYILTSLFLALGLIGCGGGGGTTPSSEDNKTTAPIVKTPVPNVLPITSFITVSDTVWDTTAVQKVLDTFAYGGHATQIQIQKWADMSPKDAIVQMLTFDAQNKLLSPTTQTLPNSSSLQTLSSFWNVSSTNNFLDSSDYAKFETVKWGYLPNRWALATMTRGLNPFLHNIGYWETNDHMAINRDSGVPPLPMLVHYDTIVQALSENKSYDEVIAQGAKNAGVAYQYGHNKNVFENGQFKGNEDFAREYYQLFMGILGEGDSVNHEDVTIPNTARVLTDMTASWHSDADGGPDTVITFGSTKHYNADVSILNTIVKGADDASSQIEKIAKIGINNAESLDNLPLMIVGHFADDNLSDETIGRIQNTWKNLTTKSLLTFIQAYAISTDFHSAKRFKYKTSIERNMEIANKMIIDNSDNSYLDYDPTSNLSKEGISVFSPIHDVFGHQTSIEASDNSNIFRINYNRSAEGTYYYTKNFKCDKDTTTNKCPVDANGVSIGTWEKDWAKVIPLSADGKYRIKDIGLWLWKRFIGDGGKNYGILEKSNITALLNGKDLALFLNPNDLTHIYTTDELETTDIKRAIDNDGGMGEIYLDSSDIPERREANRRIGLAIAFIVATPYIYAQEGL